MEYFCLVGRILFGGFFILAGIDHFTHVSMMASYTASKKIPAPKLAVLGSGVLAILGGISVVFGVQPTWGVILLVIFLVPVTIGMHNYWADTDPQARQMNQAMFKKNVALLGAALMFLAIPQPWPLSLGW
jgi:uncharacterized membrane protein YphA (DoxX/SURF4 family)